ncbi:MAG: S1 RNA-binding domain-containing protein [Anaerolineae bacterium]|nr:S1 RNA-binding domain-containing protein [Anaerolineae bacterium]
MDSNKPGSRETEELEAGTSVDAVDDTQRPNSAEASTTADESAAAQPDETPAVSEEISASAPPSEAPAEASADEGKPAADAPGDLRTGMLLQGVIVATSPTQVVIDVGEGKQGIIPAGELERMTRQTLESLRVGESVSVFVVKPRDHNGNLLLSINRAIEEQDWQQAETYRRSQEVFESRVAGYNKGGLIVRFGRLRGFVPQSQIAVERRAGISGETPEEQLGAMVNQPIMVKVMEVDRARNRLILSERAASRESREKRKESLISQLKVGEIRDGRVVSLEDFGVFVDIGGAEGLVHLTELSWQHVTHPREAVQVGQSVRVEVISVDPDQKRIGLSMRQLEADPWDRIAASFTEGQLVQGSVTKLTKFGAFAQLVDLPEIEGLIHISELSDKRVAHPREVVNEGDKLTLRVVKIDIKNRRLGLSLKRVNSAEYLDLDWSSSNDPS